MAKKKTISSVDWQKHINTVTPFSKIFAAILFIVIPFITFFAGVWYGEVYTTVNLRNFSSEKSQMSSSWPAACTEDAKICPDGSSVGRVGPQCEFAACPAQTGGDSVVCTMDAKVCPDGSYVSRQGPRCEFAPCPTDN